MFEFKLPDLGEGIAEGEILKWHISAGETIAEDAPLLDVETDKAAVTIPSPRGGRVATLNGKAGDVVNVGDVVAVIDDGAATAATAPQAETAVAPGEVASRAATAVAAAADGPVTTPTGDRRRPVAPCRPSRSHDPHAGANPGRTGRSNGRVCRGAKRPVGRSRGVNDRQLAGAAGDR